MQTRWDGIPEDAHVSGWHWVEDASGLRPLLWRGDDWPERLDRREWEDGCAVLSPEDMRGARYFGTVAMPPEVSERFRRSRDLDRPKTHWGWVTDGFGLR
jgi:hypothetical protein